MTTASTPHTWHPARHARPTFRWAPLGLAAVLLMGCGGGDNDDDGTSPPPSAGAFTVGGTVVGLGAGKTLTLQNSAADDLALNANGSFVFVTRLNSGVAYAVTVKTQPSGQRCTVTQGTGSATANVSDVQVRCENLAAATFTVGGSVSGLAGTVVLQNNGGNDLSVASNGGFTFATAVAGGSAYAVTVKTQPAGQSCAVRNGSGTVGSANVGSVEVACATSAAVLPQGDWKQELCVQTGPGQWGRSMFRISKQSETRATAEQGLATYADANCTAAGPIIGGAGSDLGTFNFDRTGATSTLSAFWGSWAQPTGQTSRTVWARKGPYLCLLGDQTPTVFPTAASVESYINIVLSSKACYTQN
ncbi:MAG: hypothetical protein ACK41V_06305 [Acidovorax sp.]|uniref:hypothetical protein n=1 Tax=Acidovorax sp. TaxID=1872122 RepID=UPI00391945A7